MKTEIKIEAVVGVVVLVAVLILVLGIYWGKGVKPLTHRNWLSVRFDDVHGLEPGDPVYVRGIQKGQIEEIGLTDYHALVRLWVDDDVPLFSDLCVSLQNRELMGGKQIIIHPGTSGQPVDFEKIHDGVLMGDIGEFFLNAEIILAKADSSLGYLNQVMKENRISEVLDKAEAVAEETRAMISENRRDVRDTIRQLEEISRRFHEDSTARRIGDLVTHLDSTVLVMRRIATQMESEEGTVGKLMADRWLYDQLMKTAVDLDSLITDLKENPKKYIHFSLF